MIRRNPFVTLFLLVGVYFLQLENICLAGDNDLLKSAGWKVIDSEYCSILLHPDVDIEKVNKKITIRFRSLTGEAFSDTEKTVERQLSEKFDLIFKKIETVLDMYPKDIHLNIKIFRTQGQLDEEYAKIFGKNDGALRISYYIHKLVTIYTTEQAIREGVLAHEIGHAIANHYFLVNLSDKIKELLAQYAEVHLDE